MTGDPPQYFSKSTAVQMGGVLPYKWEAYCSTNGSHIAGFPFLRSLEAREVRRYKWGAYCRTNWRCTAVLFRQVVGVGVSETLPGKGGLGLRGVAFMTVLGFGGFDGFGGSGKHLVLLSLVLQNTVPRDDRDGFGGFGGCVRGFEKGLAGGGWRQAEPKKQPEKFSKNMSPCS